MKKTWFVEISCHKCNRQETIQYTYENFVDKKTIIGNKDSVSCRNCHNPIYFRITE